MLFSILPGLLFADNISVEKAQKVAMNFMQSCGRAQTRGAQLRMAWDGETRMTRGEQEPAFYIFDLEGSEQGFVIVAADDRAVPILGYSLTGSFDERNIPIAMRGHLNDYRKEIHGLRARGGEACPDAKKAWAEALTQTRANEKYDKTVHGNIIAEWETAKWDQDEPYNRLCPALRGRRTLTGCQITSMCILMKHFGWPDKGVGTVPGYTTEKGTRLKSIKLGHEYHWDKMKMVYNKGQYTDEEGDLVARIMYDLGVMIRAEYDIAEVGGTGAIPQDVPRAMFTYLKYDKSMVYRPREFYGLETWMDMLKHELDRCPILYTGADDSGNGGHAFVFDGYSDNDFFRVNWGWSGMCDGWYKISALVPTDQGNGGNGGGNFNAQQGAAFDMKPDEGGKRVGADIKYMCNFPWQGRLWWGLQAKSKKISSGTPFNAEAGIFFNIGDRSVNLELSFWLCDRNGNRKEQLVVSANGGTSDIIEVGQFDPWGSAIQIPNMSMTITSPFEKGDRVRCFYKKDGEWVLVTGTTDEIDGHKCNYEIVVGEDAAADIDIEKTTSAKFDKASKTLTLMVQKGVELKVLSADGQDVTAKSTTIKGTRMEIDGTKLGSGVYTIRLTAGVITKEFKYTL